MNLPLRPAGPLRLLLAFALFAGALPWAGAGRQQLGYDAGQYWELATTFFRDHRFALLHYASSERGYAGPLLLLPAHGLARLTGWPPLTCTGLWGAGWAAVLFGWVLPQGWLRATGQGLSFGRWLALLALGWVFWRAYFLFPLLDAATLTLFGAGLLLLWQRRPLAWLAAGLALGLAVNMRPSYLISLPVAAGLAGWLSAGGGPVGAGGAARRGGRRKPSHPVRWLALLLGGALALAPQLVLNVHHQQRYTPLVLFQDPIDPRPVYLRALGWGTRVERYETGFFAEGHRTLQVPDAAGIAQLAPYGPTGFADYGQYAGFVARHPAAVAGRYARHLAHTFDLWYATPYPLVAFGPGKWVFRGLNYALLGLGLLGLWRLPRRGSGPGRLLLAALAVQVLLTVPFHVETRYGMPLHLVLLLAAVAGQPWAGPWPWRRLARWAVLGALWLGLWGFEARRQEQLAVYDPELET